MGWFSAMDVGLMLILLVLYLVWTKTSSKLLPPGPRGIPFFRNTLSFGSHPAIVKARWAQQYGDTISYHVGSKLGVTLSDIETVKQVFSMDSVMGKPRNRILLPKNHVIKEGFGIARSIGDLWKVHRKFASSTLRNLEAGKAWLEDIIIQEVEEFLQLLRGFDQKRVDPKPRLFTCTANIICGLTFGKRFALDDPKFQRLTGLFTTTASARVYEPIAETFPFLMWFPNPISKSIKAFHESRRHFAAFMMEIIQEFDGKLGETGDDVQQSYLQAYRQEQKTGSKTGNKDLFTESQLLASMIDLFNAGTQSSAITITWVLVFLLEYPNIQQKIQQDIDDNIGGNGMIRYEDHARLPYIEATIMEVQRLGCPVSLIMRVNLEEIEVDDCDIPKDTSVWTNCYSIHHDLRYWKTPDVFDPTRFLDSNRNIIKHEAFIPFSVGKRACPGENLAKMELFLFVANIVRCITLALPSAEDTISSHNYAAGALHTPHPFEMLFIPRDNTC